MPLEQPLVPEASPAVAPEPPRAVDTEREAPATGAAPGTLAEFLQTSAVGAVRDEAPPLAEVDDPLALPEPSVQMPEQDEVPQAAVTATEQPQLLDGDRPGTPPLRTDPDLERLTSEFFSTVPEAPVIDMWEPEPPPPMARGARRAMLASAVIFGGSLLGIGIYSAYHNWVMPKPAELSGMRGTLSAPSFPGVVATAPATPSQAPSKAPQEQTAQAPQQPAAEMLPEVGAQAAADGVEQAVDPSAVAEAEPEADEVAAAEAEAPEETGASAAEQEAAIEAAGTTPMEEEGGYVEMLNAANTLFRRGRHKEALSAYHRALALRPNGAQALSKIAYLEINGGHKETAKDFASRAVEADPTSSEGWIVLGAALEGLRDRAGALAAYEKCSQLGTGTYVVECRRLARR